MSLIQDEQISGANYLSIISLTLLVCQVNGAIVKFYPQRDFKGQESSFVLNPGDCVSLPYNAGFKSVKSEACVILYTEEECQGYSRKLEKGDTVTNLGNDNFLGSSYSIVTFQSCTESLGGSTVNVEFYAWSFLAAHSDRISQYINVCGCKKIDGATDDMALSLNNNGNCVRIYEHDDCTGAYVNVPAGNNPHFVPLKVKASGADILTIKSFEPCEIPEACARLNAEILSITFLPLARNLDGGYSKKYTDPLITTYNKTGVFGFEFKQSVQETAHFHVPDVFRNFQSLKTIQSVTVNAYVGVPLLSTEKFRQRFQLEMGKDGISTERNFTLHNVSDFRQFKLKRQINVGTEKGIEVSTFVSCLESYPVKYSLRLKVTGNKMQKRMTNDEIIARLEMLKGFSVIENEKGGDAVLTEFDGQMKTDFGVGTVYKIREIEIN